MGYTGLINLADSDDELAVVIAHEIAHISAKHGAERVGGRRDACTHEEFLQGLLSSDGTRRT